MWSFGCILYELALGSPIFPARDENELLEFYYITIGPIADYMIRSAKKYKQFYKMDTDGSHQLIRSRKSQMGKEHLKPAMQSISYLMQERADPALIDFIKVPSLRSRGPPDTPSCSAPRLATRYVNNFYSFD